METLAYILERYNLTPMQRGPTEIPDMGRDDLPGLFAELGFTRGVEVGTEQGVYAETLVRGCPGLHLTCVDAWQCYPGYRDHVTQAKLNRFYDATVDRLWDYDVDIMRAWSMEAVQQFEDGSLDFVYIDANHELPWVMNDICAWSQKVKPGGIVTGHDYRINRRRITHNHCVYAVQCITQAWRVEPWFLVGRRRAAEGEKRDHSRSWFWVRGCEYAYRV